MSKEEIEDMIRKFWKINRAYKAVIICVFISIGMLFGSVQLLDYIDSKTHITVPGTVYGKYVGQEHHKHYTNDIFIMAVHPYDKKYKDYSVTVDYSTFAKFDKGDNIAFVMNIFEVTDKSKYDMWYGLGMMTLLIILVALWIYLCLIPFNILDKYKKEEYIGEKKKRIDRFKYWTPNDY